MDLSANVRLCLVFLGGGLFGAGGVYINHFYSSDDSGKSKHSFVNEWKIRNEVEERVAKELNEQCVNHKVRFLDRNEDGRIDVKNNFEQEGLQEILEDQNFDGVFETVTQIENGKRLWAEVDTNGDHSFDFEIMFQHDIPHIIIISDYENGRYVKVKKLNVGKVVAENVDTNGDGTLDTAYDFDEAERVTATYSIQNYPEKRIEF